MKRKSLRAMARDARARQRAEGPVALERKHNRKVRRARNRHHMSNKRFGFGEHLADGSDNILRMDRHRHASLHHLFGNMSWEEIHNTLNDIFGVGEPALVVRVMARVARAKRRH